MTELDYAEQKEKEILQERRENYKEKWFDYLQDVTRLNWNFDFDSKESKQVQHHVNELKKLVKKASKNIKNI